MIGRVDGWAIVQRADATIHQRSQPLVARSGILEPARNMHPSNGNAAVRSSRRTLQGDSPPEQGAADVATRHLESKDATP